MKSKKRNLTLEKTLYPTWFAAPGMIIYVIIFAIPTFSSFYFALTKWNLRTSEFIGLQNFKTFFTMANTSSALRNTAIYAFSTCGLKVVIALFLAQYICNSQAKHKEYIKTMYYLPSLLGKYAIIPVVVVMAAGILMLCAKFIFTVIISGGNPYFSTVYKFFTVNRGGSLFTVSSLTFLISLVLISVLHISGNTAAAYDQANVSALWIILALVMIALYIFSTFFLDRKKA